ncbi:TLC domain-containing protein 2-like [Amphiura filiformis]|uniref:TLC domain-containing protein 2-like n=1 Tax=Amphiura filiformis TaxID=82378 RepID=UPI003B21D000
MSTLDAIVPNIRRHVDDLGDSTDGMLSSIVIYTLVGSILGFQCYNSALNFAPCPKKYEGKDRYKWRNIMGSFLHAIISGTSSLYCLYSSPEILDDLIHNYNVHCEVLVALSTGYFVYDLFDILAYKRLANTWPLLLHHVVIFCCFGIAMYTKNYLGYALVSLTAETNSIFLHARQLLLMVNTSKQSKLYLVNSIVNIITFLVFRFGVLLWMGWWLTKHADEVPFLLVAVATSGLVIMIVVNIVLFYRLLMSDFILRSDRQPKDTSILDK